MIPVSSAGSSGSPRFLGQLPEDPGGRDLNPAARRLSPGPAHSGVPAEGDGTTEVTWLQP